MNKTTDTDPKPLGKEDDELSRNMTEAINAGIDRAFNLGLDAAIKVVREKYLEDSPLWNQMFDKMIAQLEALKKKPC